MRTDSSDSGGFSMGAHEPPDVIKETYNFFILYSKKNETENIN